MAAAEAGSAEVYFAKKLANNNKKIRDSAIKRLRVWLRSRYQQGKEFEENDMLKLWKGLFYCMWFSDKLLIQEEVADNLAQLLLSFNNFNAAILFMRSFFITMGKEWLGIDRLRLDKFYMLIRKFVHQILEMLKSSQWKEESVVQVSNVLIEAAVSPEDAKCPDGIKMFVSEVILEELEKVNGPDFEALQGDVLLILLNPFITLIGLTSSQGVFRTVKNSVIEPVMKAVCEGDAESSAGLKKIDAEGLKTVLFALAKDKNVTGRSRKYFYKCIKRLKVAITGKDHQDDNACEALDFKKAFTSQEEATEEMTKVNKKQKRKRKTEEHKGTADVRGNGLDVTEVVNDLDVAESIPVSHGQEEPVKKKKKKKKNNIEEIPLLDETKAEDVDVAAVNKISLDDSGIVNTPNNTDVEKKKRGKKQKKKVKSAANMGGKAVSEEELVKGEITNLGSSSAIDFIDETDQDSSALKDDNVNQGTSCEGKEGVGSSSDPERTDVGGSEGEVDKEVEARKSVDFSSDVCPSDVAVSGSTEHSDKTVEENVNKLFDGKKPKKKKKKTVKAKEVEGCDTEVTAEATKDVGVLPDVEAKDVVVSDSGEVSEKEGVGIMESGSQVPIAKKPKKKKKRTEKLGENAGDDDSVTALNDEAADKSLCLEETSAKSLLTPVDDIALNTENAEEGLSSGCVELNPELVDTNVKANKKKKNKKKKGQISKNDEEPVDMLQVDGDGETNDLKNAIINIDGVSEGVLTDGSQVLRAIISQSMTEDTTCVNDSSQSEEQCDLTSKKEDQIGESQVVLDELSVSDNLPQNTSNTVMSSKLDMHGSNKKEKKKKRKNTDRCKEADKTCAVNESKLSMLAKHTDESTVLEDATCPSADEDANVRQTSVPEDIGNGLKEKTVTGESDEYEGKLDVGNVLESNTNKELSHSEGRTKERKKVKRKATLKESKGIVTDLQSEIEEEEGKEGAHTNINTEVVRKEVTTSEAKEQVIQESFNDQGIQETVTVKKNNVDKPSIQESKESIDENMKIMEPEGLLKSGNGSKSVSIAEEKDESEFVVNKNTEKNGILRQSKDPEVLRVTECNQGKGEVGQYKEEAGELNDFTVVGNDPMVEEDNVAKESKKSKELPSYAETIAVLSDSSGADTETLVANKEVTTGELFNTPENSVNGYQASKPGNERTGGDMLGLESKDDSEAEKIMECNDGKSTDYIVPSDPVVVDIQSVGDQQNTSESQIGEGKNDLKTEARDPVDEKEIAKNLDTNNNESFAQKTADETVDIAVEYDTDIKVGEETGGRGHQLSVEDNTTEISTINDGLSNVQDSQNTDAALHLTFNTDERPVTQQEALDETDEEIVQNSSSQKRKLKKVKGATKCSPTKPKEDASEESASPKTFDSASEAETSQRLIDESTPIMTLRSSKRRKLRSTEKKKVKFSLENNEVHDISTLKMSPVMPFEPHQKPDKSVLKATPPKRRRKAIDLF